MLQGGEPGKHGVEGIGVSFIPATFDASVCDRVIRVMDPQAFEMVRRLAVESWRVWRIERGRDGPRRSLKLQLNLVQGSVW